MKVSTTRACIPSIGMPARGAAAGGMALPPAAVLNLGRCGFDIGENAMAPARGWTGWGHWDFRAMS